MQLAVTHSRLREAGQLTAKRGVTGFTTRLTYNYNYVVRLFFTDEQPTIADSRAILASYLGMHSEPT